MPALPPDKWMTITQAVAITGRSERTIRRWIATHRLPSQRKAGRLLVNLADIGPDIEQALPDTADTPGELAGCQAEVRRLTDINAILERELEDWKRQAMGLSANQQKLIEASLPARRPWWQVWWKTGD